MSQVPDAAATVDDAVGTDDLPVDLDPRFDGLSEAELEEIHEKAMKRWRAAEQAWKPAHDASTADQRFANGEQWDEAVAAARTKANLSVLVYNQLPSKYKYIVNNGRRGIKATKVYPVSGGATKNTAKIYDGLILSIKNRSNAKSAFLHALSCAAIGGLVHGGTCRSRTRMGTRTSRSSAFSTRPACSTTPRRSSRTSLMPSMCSSRPGCRRMFSKPRTAKTPKA